MERDTESGEYLCDFTTVPSGDYRCRVAEVRPGTTRAGDERWSVRLVVVDGPHAGQQAAWDSLVFSIRGRARARMILCALGLAPTGRASIVPADLEGRMAIVDVRPVEYLAPTGQRVRRNEVPYDGWRKLPPGGAL